MSAFSPMTIQLLKILLLYKVHDEKHLTVGFPQRVMTWEKLPDRLQVKLWVYPDRLEVRGIVPIEDIANPKSP